MRQDFIRSATYWHLFYGMSMFDFASTIWLSCPNLEQKTLFELLRQLEKWQMHVLSCVDNYTLSSEVDIKMFVSDCTFVAVKLTDNLINGVSCNLLEDLKQSLSSPKKFVGKLHLVFDNFATINVFARQLAQQLHDIVSHIADNPMTVFCNLPHEMLQYFVNTIGSYINFADKLIANKPPVFYVSSANLEFQSRYLYGMVVASGDSFLNFVDSSVFLNPKVNLGFYLQQLQRLVASLLHTVEKSSLKVAPMLADHILRCAYASLCKAT